MMRHRVLRASKRYQDLGRARTQVACRRSPGCVSWSQVVSPRGSAQLTPRASSRISRRPGRDPGQPSPPSRPRLLRAEAGRGKDPGRGAPVTETPGQRRGLRPAPGGRPPDCGRLALREPGKTAGERLHRQRDRLTPPAPALRPSHSQTRYAASRFKESSTLCSSRDLRFDVATLDDRQDAQRTRTGRTRS